MESNDISNNSNALSAEAPSQIKRRRIEYVVLTVLLISVAIGAYCEPMGVLCGIVVREAFFHFRPTSYWRRILSSEGKMGWPSDEIVKEFQDNRFAIPVLQECFNDSDAGTRRTVII